MKSKQTVFVVFFTTLICCSCISRVGDSNMSSNMKYGRRSNSYKSILISSKTYQYNYQGWTIRQAFVNDTVMRIQYTKNGKITQAEIDAIFKAEDRTKNWQKMSELNRKHYKIQSSKGWKSSKGLIAQKLGSTTLQIDHKDTLKHIERYSPDSKKNIPKF